MRVRTQAVGDYKGTYQLPVFIRNKVSRTSNVFLILPSGSLAAFFMLLKAENEKNLKIFLVTQKGFVVAYFFCGAILENQRLIAL